MPIRIKLLSFLLIAVVLISSCSREKKPEEKQTVALDSAGIDKHFDALNQRIHNNPDDAAAYYERSKIFLGKNVLQQALNDIVKAVSIDSMKPEYFLLLADVCYRGLQIQKSIDAFDRCLKLDPSNIEAHLKLAELYLVLKAYPKSISEANEALKLDKSKAKAYFIKGFDYKETGDTNKAISSFETVVELEPEYYDAHIQLGNLHAARNHSISIQYYNNALRLKPNSTEALYNRGLFLQNHGELEKAMVDYRTILTIDPGYPDAHYNLGYIDLVSKKDYKSAITHFSDAVRSSPNYVEAYYNRGLCYEFLDNKVSATADFKKALEIYPSYEPAKLALRRVGAGM